MLKRRPIIVVGLTCAAVALQPSSWSTRGKSATGSSCTRAPSTNLAPTTGSGPGSARTSRSSASSAGSPASPQPVKKHNCHEPGCWRVGQYPAADGQLMLCYRHHPDYRGRSGVTSSSNGCREHPERQAAIYGKLHEAHNHRTSRRAAAHDPSSDVRHGATRPGATTSPDLGSGAGHDDRRSSLTLRDGGSAGLCQGLCIVPLTPRPLLPACEQPERAQRVAGGVPEGGGDADVPGHAQDADHQRAAQGTINRPCNLIERVRQ